MQYLGTPTKTSFNFHCITEIETMKAIDTLENKISSGHDGISSYPDYCILFNYCILFIYVHIIIHDRPQSSNAIIVLYYYS